MDKDRRAVGENDTKNEDNKSGNNLTLVLSETEKLSIVRHHKQRAKQKRRIQALLEHQLTKYDSRARARRLREVNRKSIVLFEQDYHEIMREIIERDYFPDLERMRKQLEMLRLKDQGFNEQSNIVAMQLQHILERNRRREKDRGIHVSSYVSKKNKKGWAAVQRMRRTQAALTGSFTPIRGVEEVGPKMILDKKEAENLDGAIEIDLPNNASVNLNLDSMSLDQFHRKFLSEDNASFNLLMIEQEEANAKKNAWMVEIAEKQNLKNLQLRLLNEPFTRLEAVPVHEALEGKEQKALNAILYGNEMEKGLGDDAKRRQHRIKLGKEKAPNDVLALLPVGDSVGVQQHIVALPNNEKNVNKRPNGLLTARVEPNNALFFVPDGKKIKYTDMPKMISTSSTRLMMQEQRDDVLNIGMLDETEAMRRAKHEYDRLSDDVKEKVDHWLVHGGLPPRGVEFIQRGQTGRELRDSLTKDIAESELGYEFIEENQRELLGRSLADQVLEKRRKERFNTTDTGRREKGDAIKTILMTPSHLLHSQLGGTPYGSTKLFRSGIGNSTMTHNNYPIASAYRTPQLAGMTPSSGNRSRTTAVEAINPFVMNSELIRNYVSKAASGPLSRLKAAGVGSGGTTEFTGNGTTMSEGPTTSKGF